MIKWFWAKLGNTSSAKPDTQKVSNKWIITTSNLKSEMGSEIYGVKLIQDAKQVQMRQKKNVEQMKQRWICRGKWKKKVKKLYSEEVEKSHHWKGREEIPCLFESFGLKNNGGLSNFFLSFSHFRSSTMEDFRSEFQSLFAFISLCWCSGELSMGLGATNLIPLMEALV